MTTPAGGRVRRWRVGIWVTLYIGLLMLIGAIKVCWK
jgi:hypothetical protein